MRVQEISAKLPHDHFIRISGNMTQTHPEALNVFKDSYLMDFLNLPEGYSETDLHQGLLRKLKEFLIELGRDFCFVGSEYALSRSLSLALIAEYQIQLPDKKLLQAKLHEFYILNVREEVKSKPV